MQGSNFNREIEQLTRQTEGIRRMAAGRDPDAGWMGVLDHLDASVRQLQIAHEQLQRRHQELDELHSEAEASHWRYQEMGIVHDGCLLTTPDGVILKMDLPASRLLQVDRKQAAGQSFGQFLAGNRRDPLMSLVDEVLRDDGLSGRQIRVRPAEGPQFTARLHASVIHGGQGQVISIRWLIENIEPEVRVQEQLQESERRYRQLVEMSPDGLVVYSQGRILYANPAAATMVGAASPEQLLDRPVLDLVPAEAREEAAQQVSAVPRGAAAALHQQRLLRLDGTEIHVELAYVPIAYNGHEAIQIVFRDVTERKRLQAEVVAISQMERDRIGRDLHDVLGQSLSGISFLAGALQQRIKALGLPEASDAGDIVRLATEGLGQTRALARGLFPVLLRAEELVPALKALTTDAQKIFQMSCHLEASPGSRARDEQVATHLFHIAQEAITNAARHGGARHVEVRLETRNGTLALTVQDDGKGFEPAQGSRGIGLRIMRNRAGLIGADLAVDSTPGKGTRVCCNVPGYGED